MSEPSVEELISVVHQRAGNDVLEQLAVARTLVSELHTKADQMLGHFVDQARRHGTSWTEISEVLEVSKQAVHKRFASAISDRTFERLTVRARRTIDAAEDVARSLGHSYVGTEHLLLGLYAEPNGIAAKILAAADLGREATEGAVRAMTPPRGEVPDGPIPRAPRTNTVLAGAVTEALELGHNYVGTEHLLLALYRVPAGLGGQILDRLGLDADTARQHVTEALAGYRQKQAGQ